MDSQKPNIKFTDYVGLAGDLQCMLTIWIDGERKGGTLYNRTCFPTFNRNRAIKRLKRMYLNHA